jgi:hypothetical protein
MWPRTHGGPAATSTSAIFLSLFGGVPALGDVIESHRGRRCGISADDRLAMSSLIYWSAYFFSPSYLHFC